MLDNDKDTVGKTEDQNKAEGEKDDTERNAEVNENQKEEFERVNSDKDTAGDEESAGDGKDEKKTGDESGE